MRSARVYRGALIKRSEPIGSGASRRRVRAGDTTVRGGPLPLAVGQSEATRPTSLGRFLLTPLILQWETYGLRLNISPGDVNWISPPAIHQDAPTWG